MTALDRKPGRRSRGPHVSKPDVLPPINPAHVDDTLDFRAPGIGRMRSTGEIVVLMLSLEEPEWRALILEHVAETLKIPLEYLIELRDDRPCLKCGNSLLAHRKNEGVCL